MGIFDFLLTEKKKETSINAIDVSNLDSNSGDAIVVSAQGQINNTQFFQYERGSDESQKIDTYRQLSKNAEIDEVVSDIVNESFIFQNDKRSFELDWFPSTNLSDQLKDKIYEEFKNVYNLMNFDDIGSELFNSFYVDGRIVFQKIPYQDTKKGLAKIIQLDPLNVVKVKLVPMRDRLTNMIDVSKIQEFFVYTQSKLTKQKSFLNNIYNVDDSIVDGKKLNTNEVTYITSGLTDNNGSTIGWLDKAIIPYNNLKMMEQSMVIFRVVRAPMRRAFYVDVSGLPKARAEEYMANMSNRFKCKLVYNADTGTWVDQKSVINMAEDYFIPRFNDSKTTEIQNIEGQSSQEILEEVGYMQDKLYQSLSAPKSRYAEDGNIFLFGKTDQIPRDEYRFKKFTDKVRNRFMFAFDDMLKTQLILKSIINESDWEEVKSSFFWRFTEDNAFIEYKDSELINNRIDSALKMNDLIESGLYSKMWVRKNILKQTDEEIEQIDDELFKEKKQSPEEVPQNYEKTDLKQPDGSDEETNDNPNVDINIDDTNGEGDAIPDGEEEPTDTINKNQE